MNIKLISTEQLSEELLSRCDSGFIICVQDTSQKNQSVYIKHKLTLVCLGLCEFMRGYFLEKLNPKIMK